MLRIDINALFMVINVLILFLAVRIFLWKPIHKILDQRQSMVDESLSEAEKAKTEAQSMLEERTASLAAVAEEKTQVLSEARKKAQAEGDSIVDNARARADAIIAQAEEEARSRREEILRQTQDDLSEIIVAAAAKVVGVPEEGNTELYDEFLKKAGSADD